ncbi:MAG: hypothetical protein ACO1OB_04570 [Archangium sp.]
MRVVLLLTVGLPVFATQLVAFAMPRVEVVRFVPWQQLREEVSVEQQDTTKAEVVARAPQFFAAPTAPCGEGFVAAAAPDDSSARALRFVVLSHRQAV